MVYIERDIDKYLEMWAKSVSHKPLLVRGARQVGKTTAVRHLANNFKNYVEIDLNERRDLHSVFAPQFSPQQICDSLCVILGCEIIPGETLLVFDEIQACPEAINKLRYFYERYPQLHVIATGSLLEFALEELPSFGVGRIDSIFMYPLSFGEFLRATGNKSLFVSIKSGSPRQPLHDAVHAKAVSLLKVFMAIGGMPEVVSTYVKTQSVSQCQALLDSLINSFRADFKKYRKRVDPILINDAWMSIAEQGLGKFVYSRVNRDLRIDVVKQAVQTLVMAGLANSIVHTSANGIPLGAEVDRKYCRMVLLDTGIVQRLLNLDLVPYLMESDSTTINKGAMAEVYVAEELIKAMSPYTQTELHCWHREDKQGNSEIDFVVEKKGHIVPIEVKSGTKGSMQSMRYFMELKKISKGIRTSLENFGTIGDIDIIPLYAIGEWVNKDE